MNAKWKAKLQGLTVAAASAALLLALSACEMQAQAKVSDTVELDNADVAVEMYKETNAEVVFAGDMLVHTLVWQSGEQPDGSRNYDHLFAHTKDIFSNADFAIINQETVLGGTELGLKNYPSFNSPQEIGDAEVNAGIDVILTASNHTMDSGYQALSNELAFFRDKYPDVKTVGSVMPGEGRAADSGPIILEKGDLKIAVLNYTYDLNGYDDPEGAVCMLDEGQIRHGMELANEQADIQIVCPHWGTEYRLTADDDQRRWAQLFSDLGADVVFGCHPHVIEPVEVVTGAGGNQTVVFWSTGNFMSDSGDAVCTLGGLASVDIKKDVNGTGVTGWKFTPVMTHRERGTAMSVYTLADYTEELRNASAAASPFVSSLDSYKKLAADVLGPGYDPATCTLSGTM